MVLWQLRSVGLEQAPCHANKIKEITIHSFMKSYLDAAAAVSDLHRLGFTNDFQLSGNDLLLVQEGL